MYPCPPPTDSHHPLEMASSKPRSSIPPAESGPPLLTVATEAARVATPSLQVSMPPVPTTPVIVPPTPQLPAHPATDDPSPRRLPPDDNTDALSNGSAPEINWGFDDMAELMEHETVVFGSQYFVGHKEEQTEEISPELPLPLKAVSTPQLGSSPGEDERDHKKQTGSIGTSPFDIEEDTDNDVELLNSIYAKTGNTPTSSQPAHSTPATDTPHTEDQGFNGFGNEGTHGEDGDNLFSSLDRPGHTTHPEIGTQEAQALAEEISPIPEVVPQRQETYQPPPQEAHVPSFFDEVGDNNEDDFFASHITGGGGGSFAPQQAEQKPSQSEQQSTSPFGESTPETNYWGEEATNARETSNIFGAEQDTSFAESADLDFFGNPTSTDRKSVV